MRNLVRPQQRLGPKHKTGVTTLRRPRRVADQPFLPSNTRSTSPGLADPATIHPETPWWAVLLTFALLILCGVGWATYTMHRYADLTPATQQSAIR